MVKVPPSPPPELLLPELLPLPLLLEPLPLELPPELLPPDPLLELELVAPELLPLELPPPLPPASTTSLLPDEQPAAITIEPHAVNHPTRSALRAPRFNRLSFALPWLGERM